MPLRKKIIVACVTFAFLIVVCLFCAHWMWPYGMRTCCLPCTMDALQVYAGDHFGWFPKDGKTPLESFQSLYNKTNDYIVDIGLLAGISGNREETQLKNASRQVFRLMRTSQAGFIIPAFAMRTAR